MKAESSEETRIPVVNPFSGADIEAILRHRGWLTEEPTAEIEEWMRDAAEWLGLQATLHSSNDANAALTDLLGLIFSYNAADLLEDKNNQAVMAREVARDVIRELANSVLEGGDLDSEHFREVVSKLKEVFGSQGRKIFYPLRLALAGRAGEGELDRVILLLDRASRLPLGISVKGTHQRVIEFCAALR